MLRLGFRRHGVRAQYRPALVHDTLEELGMLARVAVPETAAEDDDRAPTDAQGPAMRLGVDADGAAGDDRR